MHVFDATYVCVYHITFVLWTWTKLKEKRRKCAYQALTEVGDVAPPTHTHRPQTHTHTILSFISLFYLLLPLPLPRRVPDKLTDVGIVFLEIQVIAERERSIYSVFICENGPLDNPHEYLSDAFCSLIF